MIDRFRTGALAACLLAFLITGYGEAFAQKGNAAPRRVVHATPVYASGVDVPPSREVDSATVVRDTLRNFMLAPTVFRFPSSELFPGSTGWVHGTNSFEDQAKATRLSLPNGVTTASVEQVIVTFIHKANRVTNETYDIEVYAAQNPADPASGPGSLLSSQTFNFQNVDADEDLGTPAFWTVHTLTQPVTVTGDFFIAVNFGTYVEEDYSNIDIASTNRLGQRVVEDWEQLADGNWVNMSDSWFSAGDDGWFMWMQALINFEGGGGGGGDVTAPTITHTAPGPATEGQDVAVSADITDPGGIATATLSFTTGGSTAAPTVVPMTAASGSTFQGSIPANAVTSRGLRYTIQATDGAGNVRNSPPFHLAVRVAGGLNYTVPTSGREADAYRLISIPLDLENKNPSAVIEDDLGAYDPAEWRMYSLQASQEYAEYPNAGAMTPGRGFWLASSQSGASFSTGPGVSVPLGANFTIALHAGWNFIGTPFNYPVGLNQLSLNSGAALDIRAFEGSWAAHSAALQPFRGYAIAANAADQLVIAPFPPGGGGKQDETPDRLAAAQDDPAPDWTIRITARSNNAVDADNFALVAPGADVHWDPMDRPEPPVIGTYVSLYFPHPDWDVPFKRFSTDARGAVDGVATWDMEVHTNVSDALTLDFEHVDQVPAAYAVWLVDALTGARQDLRANATYAFYATVEPYPERFRLLVGEPDALDASVTTPEALPDRIEVVNFPNPFSTFTSIEYRLPEAQPVTLRVYNVLGEVVATLAQEASTPGGRHVVNWDGVNQMGRPVSSGLYFFVLEAGGHRVTRPIVLAR